MLFFGSPSLAQLNSFKGTDTVFLNSGFQAGGVADTNDVFFNQANQLFRETPDLIIKDNFIAGISTPTVTSTQTLGAMMGGALFSEDRNEVIDYIVQAGDTIGSVAEQFGLPPYTIYANNELSKKSALKVGQSLAIMPFPGVIYIVKSGDTISEIAKKYKASVQDIITDNNLVDEGDIYVNQILNLRNATIPAAVSHIANKTVLPNSYFIYPLLHFTTTQGLHYYNAVDIASIDGCGAPVYASASGVVQRAGYDRVGGNRVTILHPNGVSTYYGHLSSLFVSSGQEVAVGDRIGSEGKTGKTTGCHVHWQVMGARHPLAGTPVGTIINVNK